MSDIDLDHLGDLWRQQPSPAEMERLRRTAAGVSRRARIAQVVEIAAAVAVAGVVIYLAASNPGTGTLAVSALLILLLLWSQRRQRRLRAVEIKSLTGTSEDMLDQSIAQVEASLKRTRFQLQFSPPAFLCAIVFAALADHDSGVSMWQQVVTAATSGRLIVLFAWAWLPLFFIYSLVQIRGQKRELERLNTLRDSYHREREAYAENLHPTVD